MTHELESIEGWRAVMRDLCVWTSKERQDELVRNERRTSYESQQIAKRTERRAQWDVLRSASRRGVVKGLRSRKDFSWETFEREERRYGAPVESIEARIDWVNWQSKTAGK